MTVLPDEFADLEQFATTWCLATEAERYGRRLASTIQDMQAFYDAVTARAEAALDYCDQFELEEMPPDAVNLMRMLHSMVMVSFPVEVWRQPRIPDSGRASLDCVHEPVP